MQSWLVTDTLLITHFLTTHIHTYIHTYIPFKVEEYMLLANYLVAQELLLKFGDMGFIRSHGIPDVSGMKLVQDISGKPAHCHFSVIMFIDWLLPLLLLLLSYLFLLLLVLLLIYNFSPLTDLFTAELGYELDITSASTIQTGLNNMSRSASEETVHLISMMLAKPVPEAQYRVAGDDPAEWRHYALSIPYYTHFTSPIRCALTYTIIIIIIRYPVHVLILRIRATWLTLSLSFSLYGSSHLHAFSLTIVFYWKTLCWCYGASLAWNQRQCFTYWK